MNSKILYKETLSIVVILDVLLYILKSDHEKMQKKIEMVKEKLFYFNHFYAFETANIKDRNSPVFI